MEKCSAELSCRKIRSQDMGPCES